MSYLFGKIGVIFNEVYDILRFFIFKQYHSKFGYLHFISKNSSYIVPICTLLRSGLVWFKLLYISSDSGVYIIFLVSLIK